MLHRCLLAIVCFVGFCNAIPIPATAADSAGFSLNDVAGDHLDVLLDGRIVARYMYAHDTSTPARQHDTYKPYLHVFDAEGKAPITKGPGGQFTHHRGIFIGWMKMKFEDKTYDRWHMKGGDIVHQKFVAREASSDHASFTSVTHWQDASGEPFVVEERTMSFGRTPAPGRVIIDFHTRLTAPRGDVTLDGDPEHAGVQYRPANEIDPAATTYLFPKERPECHKEFDYPWVGETYALGGKTYSVIDINPPTNPKKTRFSAYRDYGRFGAFPVATIKKGESQKLDYRFVVFDGEMPPVALIQKLWDEFAQVKEASPVPKVTMVPAERAAPKKDAKKEPAKAGKKS